MSALDINAYVVPAPGFDLLGGMVRYDCVVVACYALECGGTDKKAAVSRKLAYSG